MPTATKVSGSLGDFGEHAAGEGSNGRQPCPSSPTAQVSRLAGVGAPMRKELGGQERREREGLLDKETPLEAALPVQQLPCWLVAVCCQAASVSSLPASESLKVTWLIPRPLSTMGTPPTQAWFSSQPDCHLPEGATCLLRLPQSAQHDQRPSMSPCLPRTASRTGEGQHVRTCTEMAAPARSRASGSRRNEGRTGVDVNAQFPCDLASGRV